MLYVHEIIQLYNNASLNYIHIPHQQNDNVETPGDEAPRSLCVNKTGPSQRKHTTCEVNGPQYSTHSTLACCHTIVACCTFTMHSPTSDFTYEKRGQRMCSSVVLPQVFSVRRSLDTNMLLSLQTKGQDPVLKVQTGVIYSCAKAAERV